MRAALVIAAALLVAFGHGASAQVPDRRQFPLVTSGLTVTVLSVEIYHVQVDNTIDVAVVLSPSRAISGTDGTIAAAEFCIRYIQEMMAPVRAQGTQTPVHVFVPLFVRSATEQTGFAFAGETCPLDPPFPAELRAAALQSASAPLSGLRR